MSLRVWKPNFGNAINSHFEITSVLSSYFPYLCGYVHEWVCYCRERQLCVCMSLLLWREECLGFESRCVIVPIAYKWVHKALNMMKVNNLGWVTLERYYYGCINIKWMTFLSLWKGERNSCLCEIWVCVFDQCSIIIVCVWEIKPLFYR